MEDYPKELTDQNLKAQELVKSMMLKVLNREEPFTLTLRSGQRRYSRDSSLVLVPPIEV
jgi:hypothetical protein